MVKDFSSDRIRKNITIGERRTSASLEEQVWDGLVEICRREEVSIDELCTEVDDRRIGSSMSSSLRVFLLTYFRLAADTAEQLIQTRRASGSGMAQPPQASFPGNLDRALERFGADQKRFAKT